MTTHRNEPTPQETLRLWPGVVIVALQWLLRFGIPVFAPEATAGGVFGALFGGLAVIVWWGFFSRAPKTDRWSAILVMVVAMVAASQFLHESIATAMMGMTFVVYAVPVLSLAFVAWAASSRLLADGPRRATMVATILLACAVWTLVQTGGFSADLDHDFSWRWEETPEERLMARSDNELLAPAAASAMDWSRLARVSRTGPRRHHPRPAD